MSYKFNSQYQLGPIIDPVDSSNLVKNIPMLFSANLDFAYRNGGAYTKEFINHLSDDFFYSKNLIIDSRVHMLMPDYYPCIPGWHHDDVPRSREDGQPNYVNPEYHAKHCMMLVNGDIAPTEFAIGEAEFPEIEKGKVIYKEWHPIVHEKIEAGELKAVSAPSDTLIYFDDHTWHRGTRAVKAGWRFFIRATINTGRKPVNEIRQQVQVYVDPIHLGW